MDTTTALLIASSTIQTASDIHFVNVLLLILVVLALIDFIRRVIIPSRSNSRYD